MTFNRFDPGTILEISGARYFPSGYSDGRLVFKHSVTGENYRCEQPDGSFAMPTDLQFNDMLLDPQVALRSGQSVNPIRSYNDESEWTYYDVAKLDEEAIKRLRVCQLLDDLGTPNGNKAIEKALAKHWTSELIDEFGEQPNPRTVRNWRKSRGMPGNRQARHMVSLVGKKVAKLASKAIADQVLWCCILAGRKAGRKVASIHADYVYQISRINADEHELIPAPSKPIKPKCQRTTRRRFDALESDDTLASHIEKEAIEQDWMGGGMPLTADRVMQRVIIDHTRMKIHVACPKLEMVLGRPWITLAIDVKSRAIVAYVITFLDPDAWTVGECFRRMVLPKRPPPQMAIRYAILSMLRGKPSEVFVDNGVELRGHAMEGAARNAGFSVTMCPIRRARYRAICERAIQTMDNRLSQDLPGRVLSIHDARRWGYDAEKEAIVMMDELEAVANQIVADYNVSPHDGIGDRQPALVFEQDIARFGINNFNDLDAFRRDTMDIVENVQLSNTGIRAFGLRYCDISAVPELLNDLVPLEPRRQRRDDATATVQFRYDPADISRIYVWNRKARTYVELTCSNEIYADGMPLWLHDRIKAEAKAAGAAFNTEEERLSMRGHLIHAIQSISPRERAEQRKRVAELLEIPRIRQVTGNIVDLVNVDPEPVSLGNFIANDRAALTALDHEILSPRPAPRKGRSKTALDHRREETAQAQAQIDQPKRPRRNIAGKGGYA